MPSTPVKVLCAIIAGLGWLTTYLAPTYPTVTYWMIGVEGTLIAVGLYLGWPVPNVSSPTTTI